MADTPQAESQQEQTSTENLPSEALYLDWETAMHRAKALFAAIRAMGGYGLGEGDLIHIIDLAAIGQSIIEDQLTASKE